MQSASDIVAALGFRESDFERLSQFRHTDLVAGATVLHCASVDEVLLAQQRQPLRALCVCAPEPAARLNELAHWLLQRGERIPTLLAYPDARAGDVPWGSLQPVLMPMREAVAPAKTTPGQGTVAFEDRVSLDHLISGIAHDFNNLLAIIMGEVQLAHSRSGDDRVNRHLDRAEEGCYRLAGEIRRLMTLQDATADKRGVMDLNRVVGDSRELLASMLPDTARLDLDLSKGPLWVEAAPGTLRHILLNLAAYGLSEVHHCKHLTVRCQLDHECPLTEAGKDTVMLEMQMSSHAGVRDSAPDARPRQTENHWEGGVSLAVVWKLAADLGGYADTLRTTAGTVRLRVYLPNAFARTHATASSGQLSHLWGSERVLILSSDAPDARQLARNLASLGYRAEVFSDTDALSHALTADGNAGECILLDGARRGTDLGQLHQTLRHTAPGTPILIATPETAPPHEASIVSDGWTCVVRKPFDLREIALTVRALARPAKSFPAAAPLRAQS
ncbi:MAG: hypothetical protein GC168_00465 [Candidatus Hydrogenedens sp.]|nr:hypothetical protein [Candidatus Hydrogenedens sp.]